MSIIDNVRKLPAPFLVMHIASKAILGFGLGIVLAKQLSDFGGWLIALGLLLSIAPGYKIIMGE